MLMHPQIDPVAIQIGPFAVHWYGLMYVFGFISVYFLTRKQLRESGDWGQRIDAARFESLFTWLILGVVLGGRLGYILFYNLGYYVAHPLEVLYVWQGGMSFHGGLIGPIVAGLWYCRKHNLPFLLIADRISTVAPLALAFGRFGNFINGELWGRVTDAPWGMIFAGAGNAARHPSQLYELALEGLALFALLWLTRRRDWPDGTRVALFLTGYGAARIFCEQFRQPDAQLGFLFGSVTMGMTLSSLMVIIGGAWLWRLLGRRG